VLECGFDAVGDEREGGASILPNRLAGVVGDDKDRHVEGRFISPPTVPGVISPCAANTRGAELLVPPYNSRPVLELLTEMPGLAVVQAISACTEWLLAWVPKG
jgi:hypothetical protein